MSDAAPRSRLAQRLGLRPAQSAPFVGLFVTGWLFGVAMIAFYSAASAHFLDVWTPDQLPWTYIAAAIVATAAGATFAWTERRLGLRWTVIGTVGLMAVGVAVQWTGLAADARDPALTFIGPVWFRVLWVLGNLTMWSQANALLDLRQSRRLLPLLTLSVVMGVLSYGLVNAAVVGALGTVNLLLLVAALLAGATAMATWTAHGRRPRATITTPDSPLGPAARRFVVLLLAYDGLATASAYVADYAFMDAVKRHYPDSAAMAVFFARYMGGMTLAALVATAVLSPWVLRRFGPAKGLTVTPGAMSIAALGALVGFAMGAPDLAVFSLVVALKGSSEASVTAFTGPSVRTLVRAFPGPWQVRVLSWYDAVVAPLTTGLAGVGLLVAAYTGASGETPALIAIAALVALALTAALAVHAAYPALLRQSLVPAALQPADLEAPEAPLDAVDADVALLALRIGWPEDEPDPMAALSAGLRHPRPEVRARSAGALGARGPGAAEPLRQALQAESDPQVGAALVQALAVAAEGRADDVLVPMLDDGALGEAALPALLAHGGPAGASAALRSLQAHSTTTPADRLRLAAIIARSGRASLSGALAPLVGDPDTGVRRAAVHAAGAIGSLHLAPVLVGLLDDTSLWREARDALKRLGAPALPLLRSTIAGGSPSARLALDLARAAGGPDAVRLALDAVRRRGVRGRALEVLVALGVTDPPGFDALLDEVRAEAEALLAHTAAGAADPLRAMAWDRAARATLADALLLLALAGPDPASEQVDVLLGRRLGDPSVALELLDATVSRAERSWLLPLAEAVTGGRRGGSDAEVAARALADDPRLPPLLRVACGASDPDLAPWIESEDAMLRPWEKALALHRTAPFRELDDDALASLAARSTTVMADDGDLIVAEGDPPGAVYVVATGQVRVQRDGVVLGSLSAGSVFGELVVFSPGPRTADVVADGPATLLSFPGEVLATLIEDEPRLARAFLRQLSDALRRS